MKRAWTWSHFSQRRFNCLQSCHMHLKEDMSCPKLSSGTGAQLSQKGNITFVCVFSRQSLHKACTIAISFLFKFKGHEKCVFRLAANYEVWDPTWTKPYCQLWIRFSELTWKKDSELYLLTFLMMPQLFITFYLKDERINMNVYQERDYLHMCTIFDIYRVHSERLYAIVISEGVRTGFNQVNPTLHFLSVDVANVFSLDDIKWCVTKSLHWYFQNVCCYNNAQNVIMSNIFIIPENLLEYLHNTGHWWWAACLGHMNREAQSLHCCFSQLLLSCSTHCENMRKALKSTRKYLKGNT